LPENLWYIVVWVSREGWRWGELQGRGGAIAFVQVEVLCETYVRDTVDLHGVSMLLHTDFVSTNCKMSAF